MGKTVPQPSLQEQGKSFIGKNLTFDLLFMGQVKSLIGKILCTQSSLKGKVKSLTGENRLLNLFYFSCEQVTLFGSLTGNLDNYDGISSLESDKLMDRGRGRLGLN